MAQIRRVCPHLGIRFLAIAQPFLGQLGRKFLWELRRLLSINRWWQIQVMILFFILDFWSNLWQENGCGHHKSGASKPKQKVGPLGGPFGPTAISKSYFRNFQAWTPSLLKCLMIIIILYGYYFNIDICS